MAELSAEQWMQVKQFFERAAELPPEQRSEFLERACADQDIRQEVVSLLPYAGSMTAELAIAAVAAAVANEQDPDQRLIGMRLGPYRVEAIAGHGGMGAVYRAERDDAEFRQRVAIKLVRAVAASPAALSRFKQERQILARLSHPNIARLLDGGSTPEGVPYLVMEFIEGEPVTVWCERQSLRLDDRLRVFVQVCDAVEHAHRLLIVHRDLKPANILVTPDGSPKLLDFGIAKLLDASADAEAVTKTGSYLMTPDYASPEQVRGELVTPAADVYSLGLILYELLTGQKAQQIEEYSAAAIAQVVCQAEPPAPAALRPELAGDLDSITRMALRKEPDRRYRSAGELGRDLHRYLDKLPVTARPDTLAYRSAKFVRRNRAAVAAAVVVLATIAGGLSYSLAARQGAEKRVPRVIQVRQLTQIGSVEVGGPLATDGVNIYFAMQQGGRWWLAQVPVEGGAPRPVAAAQSLIRPDIMDLSPDRSSLLVAAGNEEVDQALWVVPTGGGLPHRLSNLFGHTGVWSRDGRKIVFASDTALYQANTDGTDRHKLRDTPGVADLIRRAPAPGPDVLRFHVVNSQHQSALWEMAADGSNLHRLLPDWTPGAEQHNERAGGWSSSGKYYFFQSWHDRVLALWAMREGRSLLSFDPAPVQIYSTATNFESLAVSPDDRRIFIGSGQERYELMRYQRSRNQFLPFLPGVAGRYAAYSRDARWVAYVTHPEGELWRSRPDGTEAVLLTPRSMRAAEPSWSPDGSRIAFAGVQAGKPKMIYLIPVNGGTPQPIPSASYIIGGASWSPDGKSLAFGCFSFAKAPVRGGISIIELSSGRTRFLEGSDQLTSPAWSPDGRYVAANGESSQLQLYDFRTQRWSLLANAAGLSGAYWSGDGSYVYFQEAFGGLDQPIMRVQIRTRKIERMMGLKQIPQSNVTGYSLAGMAPDDAPVANVIRSNSDIYALDLNLP